MQYAKCDSRTIYTINAQSPRCKIAAESLEEHRNHTGLKNIRRCAGQSPRREKVL